MLNNKDLRKRLDLASRTNCQENVRARLNTVDYTNDSKSTREHIDALPFSKLNVPSRGDADKWKFTDKIAQENEAPSREELDDVDCTYSPASMRECLDNTEFSNCERENAVEEIREQLDVTQYTNSIVSQRKELDQKRYTNDFMPSRELYDSLGYTDKMVEPGLSPDRDVIDALDYTYAAESSEVLESEQSIIEADSVVTGELTSYEMAKDIMKQFHIRYLDPLDTIPWIYVDKCYRPLGKRELYSLIYHKLPDPFKEKHESCETFRKNVADYIYAECDIPGEDIARTLDLPNLKNYRQFTQEDRHKIDGKVVFQNGVYDVRTGVLSDFTSELPFYYALNANFLKAVLYDELSTPFFDKFLRDATGNDKDSMRMIMQVMGAILLPNRVKAFFVAGPASNSGKSILGAFLRRLFGNDRVAEISPSALKEKFALGNVEDKVLILCMDAEIDTLSAKAVSEIKRITGEEHITSQAKYKDSHDVVVRFKMLYGTNGAFGPKKRDDGWNNRLIALPFTHGIPKEEQIADLIDKLWEERDAIATKVVLGMEGIVHEDGRIDIQESSLSVQQKNLWTAVNTFLTDYLEEGIEVTGDQDDRHLRTEIHDHYKCFFSRMEAKEKLKGKPTGVFTMLKSNELIEAIISSSQGKVWLERSRKNVRIDEKTGKTTGERQVLGLRLIDF